MQTLTLQDAQSRLPELIDAAVSGEEVTIARNDGTIVALMLLQPTFGSATGLIKSLDGFDDPDESAQLYAEIYAEDLELQGLTASAIEGWNSL
jgi:antitoxin (DNA-binding transcriptional repressor) of toxin-antitoxin stability system